MIFLYPYLIHEMSKANSFSIEKRRIPQSDLKPYEKNSNCHLGIENMKSRNDHKELK